MNIPAIEQQNTQELPLPEELYLLAEVMAKKAPNCAIFTLVEDLENYHGRYNGIMWPYEVDLIKNNVPDFEQEGKNDPLRVSVSCVTTKKLSQENQEIDIHKKLEVVCGAIGAWNYTLEMPILCGGIDPVTITYFNRKKGISDSVKNKSTETMFRSLAHAIRYRLEHYTIIANTTGF